MHGAAFTLCVLVVLALMPGIASDSIASAQEQNTGEAVGRRDIPAAVRAEVDCGTTPDFITRHVFGNGYLFSWDCASNHANSMQALVYADRRDGSGARLIRFPRPGDMRGSGPATTIANKRLFPPAGEIVESFVDMEGSGLCRFESRWRLIGETKRPMLISHRRTRDCRGVTGWVNVIPKDVTGTRDVTGDIGKRRTRW
jgi:hypothetical protein